MRKYNRLNCDSTVRARFIDTWGRVITLVHAIHIEGVRTVTETFENGTLARKRFNELKKETMRKI